MDSGLEVQRGQRSELTEREDSLSSRHLLNSEPQLGFRPEYQPLTTPDNSPAINPDEQVLALHPERLPVDPYDTREPRLNQRIRPNRKAQELPPSHPDFDISKFTDKEYIELLLFEVKELRALLDVKATSNGLPISKRLEITDNNDAEESVDSAEISHASPEIPLTPTLPLAVNTTVKSPVTSPLETGPKEEVEIPLRSSRRRRNSRSESETVKSIQPREEVLESQQSTSQVKLEILPQSMSNISNLSGLAKSMSIRSTQSETYNGDGDTTVHENEGENYPTNAMVNDSYISIKSEISRTRSNQSQEPNNKIGYSQNKNQSTSSFSSYKSRIKLPLTLQHQQEKRDNLESPTSINPSDAQSSLRSPLINDFHDATSVSSSAWTNGRFETPPTQNSDQFSSQVSLEGFKVKEEFKGAAGVRPVPSVHSGLSGDINGYDRVPLTPDGITRSPFIGGGNDDILRTPNVYSDSRPQLQPLGSGIGGSLSSGVSKGSFQVLQTPKLQEDETILFIKPKDFQTINIVIQSTIPLNVNSKRPDEPNCTIVINDRDSTKEMWRIRKTYTQLVAFDNEIRPVVEYFGLPALPDKALFMSTSPVKIELRRAGLQNYFNTIFLMPHIPQMVLFRICRYLSLDFVNPLDDYKSGATKEGFLIRKYKGLGTNWKIRWCQVDGPSLEIYETPGGPLLEQIRLKNCQIGRQSNDTVAEDKGYRHAFLIMESQRTKLSSSHPKHFFCAETDEERDDWVNILLQFNEILSNLPDTETIVSAESPARSFTQDESVQVNDQISAHSEEILPVSELSKKSKKRYFGFRRNDDTQTLSPVQGLGVQQTPGISVQTLPAYGVERSNGYGYTSPTTPGAAPEMQHYLDQLNLDEGITKSIFGRDINDAYQLSNHIFFDRSIPSICYRCLDYLVRTGAVYEEGIFRLSGSASTIRQLKEQFNMQFDIDLFESPLKPDMHTVAGLFKGYLRELPNPIMGIHAYNHLNQVILQNSKTVPPSSMAMVFRDYFSELVDRVNYDICYVIFKFLREIVAHQQNNRMNLRNVCIVFVPTLNISLEVLSTFLVDFDCIFEGARPLDDDKREVLDLHIPNF